MPQAKPRSSTSLRTLIERHRRARRAYIDAFWVLVDHPAAHIPSLRIPEMWSLPRSSEFFAGSFSLHADIDRAAKAYIGHCRKKGRWGYDSATMKTPKFDVASLRAYRQKIVGYHKLLDDGIREANEKNAASGHTGARRALDAAVSSRGDAWRALSGYIEAHASPLEIGAFANYVLAAYGNDFEAHLAERQRHSDTGRSGLASLERLDFESDNTSVALGTVRKGLARIGRRRQGARRAA